MAHNYSGNIRVSRNDKNENIFLFFFKTIQHETSKFYAYFHRPIYKIRLRYDVGTLLAQLYLLYGTYSVASLTVCIRYLVLN